jgi:single-strand DNA-binding protein
MQKSSLNKIIIIGHLGADPEGRYTQQGNASTTFSLATNESWKNQSGQFTEHTEWHHVIAWGKLAEFAKEHLYQGQLVNVEGSIRTQNWVDKEGAKHKKTEVFCTSIIPLEWKKTT